MAELGTTFDVPVTDLAGLADLAVTQKVDLTLVGPEIPLVAGIVDVFTERGLRVFGPSKAAAEIEGSKVFCNALSKRHGVPVAAGESFDDADAAIDFARTVAPPIVVKADGLAAGKGVLIAQSFDEARDVIEQMMRGDMFGASGSSVIVEEFLEGREISMFCVTDGNTNVFLDLAQDYKRAYDGDEGLNTGGMGAYSPVPWLSDELAAQAQREIVVPLIEGLAEEGRPYVGCFYAGLIVTAKGPYLIEVNARFGDPETQILMPRLRTDLAEVLSACVDGELSSVNLEWSTDAGVTVVVASGGYPESYGTGYEIEGVSNASSCPRPTSCRTTRPTSTATSPTRGRPSRIRSAPAPTRPASRSRARWSSSPRCTRTCSPGSTWTPSAGCSSARSATPPTARWISPTWRCSARSSTGASSSPATRRCPATRSSSTPRTSRCTAISPTTPTTSAAASPT
jgi:phosphoribosylamine--glycine ligase